MRLEQRYHWLILAVAVTIWIGVGVFAMAIVFPGRGSRASSETWALLFAVFGAALLCSVLIGPRPRKTQMVLIGVETLSVLAMTATHRGSPGPLLTPIALQVALLFGARPALVWIVVQSALARLAFWSFITDPASWFYWCVDIAGELIAVGAVTALRRDSETSLALGRINAELRATHALLAEKAAEAERMRISRELHDAWGHDLTALSLQLEYASHVSPELARPSVIEARDLAKSLLAKVRDVVGTLRRYEGADIKPVLEALASGAPQLAVHLEISDTLALQSADAPQTLMRSAQEIITNTLRHARARNLWLALKTEDGRVKFESRDDGEGTEHLRLGHGLKGLLERFEQQGGEVTFETARGHGFKVRGWLPTRRPHP